MCIYVHWINFRKNRCTHFTKGVVHISLTNPKGSIYFWNTNCGNTNMEPGARTCFSSCVPMEHCKSFLPALCIGTLSFNKHSTRNAGSTLMRLSSFFHPCAVLPPTPSFASLSLPSSVKLWHLVRGLAAVTNSPPSSAPHAALPPAPPLFCMILIDSFIDCKEIGRSYNTAGPDRVMKKGGMWLQAWMAAWVADIYCHTSNEKKEILTATSCLDASDSSNAFCSFLNLVAIQLLPWTCPLKPLFP